MPVSNNGTLYPERWKGDCVTTRPWIHRSAQPTNRKPSGQWNRRAVHFCWWLELPQQLFRSVSELNWILMESEWSDYNTILLLHLTLMFQHKINGAKASGEAKIKDWCTLWIVDLSNAIWKKKMDPPHAPLVWFKKKNPDHSSNEQKEKLSLLQEDQKKRLNYSTAQISTEQLTLQLVEADGRPPRFWLSVQIKMIIPWRSGFGFIL